MVVKAINQSLCPLCGQANQCAVEQERLTGEPQAPCWCLTASFSQALLSRVPLEKRNISCICANCAKLDANASK